jgi:hypothetical protein
MSPETEAVTYYKGGMIRTSRKEEPSGVGRDCSFGDKATLLHVCYSEGKGTQ